MFGYIVCPPARRGSMSKMEYLVSHEDAWYGRVAPAVYDAPSHLSSSTCHPATGFRNNIALNQTTNPHRLDLCNETTVQQAIFWQFLSSETSSLINMLTTKSYPCRRTRPPDLHVFRLYNKRSYYPQSHIRLSNRPVLIEGGHSL